MGISCYCFPEDDKETYRDQKRTCTALFSSVNLLFVDVLVIMIVVVFLGPVLTYPDIFESATFFFRPTSSVHTHPANSTANPDIFKSALQSEKNKSSMNPITCGRVNPDIFESDDVAN